jgi:hypothetical protein
MGGSLLLLCRLIAVLAAGLDAVAGMIELTILFGRLYHRVGALQSVEDVF